MTPGGAQRLLCRRSTRIAAGLVILLGIVCGRVAADQRLWLRTAETHLANANPLPAIIALGRALDAHLPFSPWEARAEHQLLELAATLETTSQVDLAQLAYETWRTSRYTARHWWLPGAMQLGKIEERIAALKAARSEMNPESERDRQLRRMRRDLAPAPSLSLLCVTLLASHLAAAAAWAVNGRRVWLGTALISLIGCGALLAVL